ncbi:MAG: chaperone NapD [Coriobacteriales bacterium]|jgi:nitrate reductase NapD|nr:chaperone NapD [Coriobacteriales bacterium]
MVISSYVLDTLPKRSDEAAQAVVQHPGVELHVREDTKLVVTIEAPSIDATYEVATALSQTAGVLTTSLVYCNFEDEAR